MKSVKKKNGLPVFMLIFSLFGFGLFYLFPFLFSLIYALTDNPLHFNFVGIDNFTALFQNKYFMNGLMNTVTFLVIAVPLNLCLSLMAALVINGKRTSHGRKYTRYFSLVFLIPLVIPSATTAFFWSKFFDLNGSFNKILHFLGVEKIDWIQSKYAMGVMIFIFLWKNIGYNMALFIGGLNNIPESYYECADIEGATALQKFQKITLVYLTPSFFLTLIMTFVNSFKIFKEIYLLTGEYPAENIYVLQHFMNNMFLALNYPKLTSAVYILTIVVVFFIAGVFKIERKITDNISVY